MISKRSRRASAPVENLKQSGFNGSKGINISAAAEDSNTVLLSKNFDIEPDGSLKLRKPVIIRQTLPEVISENNVIETDVVFAGYMFDNESLFIVRKDKSEVQYVGIFKNKKVETFQINFSSWDTFEEHILYPYEEFVGEYVQLPYLDFSNLSLVNSATSTILTNVKVNIMSSAFKIVDKTYEYANQTELFYPTLYDYESSAWKYRTLSIFKSDFSKTAFNIKILTPEPTTIDTSEQIVLNANLDADNPYAIRDAYGTTAPTIKSILPYVPCINKGTSLEYIPDVNTDEDTSVEEFTEPILMSDSIKASADNTLSSVGILKVVEGSGNATVSSDGESYFDVEILYTDKSSGYSDEDFKIKCSQVARLELTAVQINNVTGTPGHMRDFTVYAPILHTYRYYDLGTDDYQDEIDILDITKVELLNIEKINNTFLKKTVHRIYFKILGLYEYTHKYAYDSSENYKGKTYLSGKQIAKWLYNLNGNFLGSSFILQYTEVNSYINVHCENVYQEGASFYYHLFGMVGFNLTLNFYKPDSTDTMYESADAPLNPTTYWDENIGETVQAYPQGFYLYFSRDDF